MPVRDRTELDIGILAGAVQCEETHVRGFMQSNRRRRTGDLKKRHARQRLSLVVTALLAAIPVSAQVPVTQTVVVTAAATPVELGSVTRSLRVITRDEIGQMPVHSVADVLRLTGSVDVRARGIRGTQTDFAVRGATFGQMLVLVDGVRLNDAQSGHHNGDIPVPLDAVERIEVLYGAGSSLFGADAFGGTINVITRQRPSPTLVVEGGSSDLFGGRAATSLARGAVRQAVSASFDQSSGFMYDRDFTTAIASSRTGFGDRTNVSVSYLWKEFGANGFYGNAPSREWTNQTLVAADHRVGSAAGWTFDGRGSYRTHGDRFVFNQTNPALSDNRHRTHAVIGSLAATRRLGTGTALALGVEGGGEWIRSTNLGDHETRRISGFGEWRQELGRRTQLDASLRMDHYSEFGASWSPAAGVSFWPSRIVRVRGTAGRAFRVPTFTERYYRDPNHLARPEIGPETAWTGEGGVDLFAGSDWMFQTTVFTRSEEDVIDWLRTTTAERWRTYNIHHVETRGVEASARRTFANGAFVQGEYTYLDTDAAAVAQLSKYVLDVAPHSFAAAAAVMLPGAVRVAPRVEIKHRTRPGVTQDYALFDVRVGRRLTRDIALFVEGTNLFDATYQEVTGVAMPGAAWSVSLTIGR
jgi:iron complex outermembrane receptor protein